MDATIKKSILQMSRGAIMERADYEMSNLLDNILDANTSPTAKRKLTLTLELCPDANRETITVKCTAKSTPAPTNAVVTSLYVADQDNIVEMTPQIGGQFTIDGGEQEPPASLKLIKFA